MKPAQIYRSLLAISAATIALIPPAHAAETARITSSFDNNWRFYKGDAPGAEKPTFAAQLWRQLNVPHDWSIEGPFDRNNPTGGMGGFLPAGVGWYRKQFTLPANAANRRVFLDFDGVMANSDVWVNGFHLGNRPYGYVSFRYELTGHLNFGPGKTNIIAVRADNSGQPASRWYTGAGIYRHVRLVTTAPVHLQHWGTFVTTPKVTASQAIIQIQSKVENQSKAARNVALQFTLLDPTGKSLRTITTKTQNVPAGATIPFQSELTLTTPKLWNLDSPRLYHVITQIRYNNATLDDETTTIGLREFHFAPATGFWLNGKNFKIKGVALHHDASALGAAVPLGAWERRLKALKALGVNAIRTAHNPPAPEFLDLCDRMGFLVMDELFDAWIKPKQPYDYHLAFKDWCLVDARDTALRDRNHPSVILYSAGNEIRDTPNASLAKEILTALVDTFHTTDPTRPVTQGLFRPNASHDYDNGLADILDVVGQNYREKEILAAYQQKPTRKILGTENGHDRNSWLALRDNPQYSGQFLWTGVDYLGEARNWPDVGTNSGLLFRTGTPRPLGYQRQSWWSDKPMVNMARRSAPTPLLPTDPGYDPAGDRRPQVLFTDWTPTNTAPHSENVEVYSNCQQVELFLNDTSLGAKEKPANDSPRNWTVPFQPGTLRAVATNNGKTVATCELKTAGPPAKILLTADKSTLTPNWDDITYLSAKVVDEKGIQVPTATNLITFQSTSPGQIVAVDNADNASHAPFQTNQRHAFQGECFAFIKSKASQGRITITASSPGLKPATLIINATPK